LFLQRRVGNIAGYKAALLTIKDMKYNGNVIPPAVFSCSKVRPPGTYVFHILRAYTGIVFFKLIPIHFIVALVDLAGVVCAESLNRGSIGAIKRMVFFIKMVS
jgi:hypothetical protein